MLKRLRAAIARQRRRMWQRTYRVRELLGFIAAKRQRGQEDSRQNAARARFWADLREGHREAEARCSRQDP
jgi:hypothetical protein